MKIDIHLPEHFDQNLGGALAKGKSGQAGEFAALLDKALAGDAELLTVPDSAKGSGAQADSSWVDAVFAGANHPNSGDHWFEKIFSGEDEAGDALTSIMASLGQPASASDSNQDISLHLFDKGAAAPDAKTAIFLELQGNKGAPGWFVESGTAANGNSEALRGLFNQGSSSSLSAAGLTETDQGAMTRDGQFSSQSDFRELFSRSGGKATASEADLGSLVSPKGDHHSAKQEAGERSSVTNILLNAEQHNHQFYTGRPDAGQANANQTIDQTVYNPGGEKVPAKEILPEAPNSREPAAIMEQSGVQQHLNRQPSELEILSRGLAGSDDRQAAMRAAVAEQVEGRLVYLRERGSFPAEMRLTLNPPELGEIKIRVISKQGKLSASIFTESALVKEILESSISELRQRVNFVNIQFEQLDFSTLGKETGGSEHGGNEEGNHAGLHGRSISSGDTEAKSDPDPAGDSIPELEGIEFWA